MNTTERPKVNYDAKTGDVVRVNGQDFRVIDTYPTGMNLVDLDRMDELNMSTPQAMRAAFKELV